MPAQFTAGRFKAWADNGTPLTTARLYTYVSGTTTHKDAYTTSTLATPVTYTSDGLGGQYIAMDARGEAQLWLGLTGPYTMTLKTAAGAVIESTDGVVNEQVALNALSSSLALANGGVNIGYQLDGVGTVLRDLFLRAKDSASFEDFLPLAYNYTTDDASVALVAAATWSAANKRAVVFGKRYRLSNCATISAISGIRFEFRDCEFHCADTGTSGTITNGASGKVAMLFKNCADLNITGNARFYGLGTPGTTTLAGIVFDTCPFASVTAHMYFKDMAAGRFVFWCDYGVFGDLQTDNMYGQQTFSSGTQGSAEVCVGNQYSVFGKITAKDNYKPVRYLSVALNGAAVAIDNIGCTFGHVSGNGRSGSLESCLYQIRSSLDCIFDGAAGKDFVQGAFVGRYSTDTGFSINRSVFGPLTGVFKTSGASVDAAVEIYSENKAAVPIGSFTFESIKATCAGEFGLFLGGGGVTTVLEAEITGAPNRGIVVYDSTLQMDRSRISGQNLEAFTIGQGANINADLIDVQSGNGTAGQESVVRYNAAFGTGGPGVWNIDTIRYRKNGIGNDPAYVAWNSAVGLDSVSIRNIDGVGSVTPHHAQLVGHDYQFRNGQMLTATSPTGATHNNLGMEVLKSNAAVGATEGWRLTAAGTPGTWTAKPNL